MNSHKYPQFTNTSLKHLKLVYRNNETIHKKDLTQILLRALSANDQSASRRKSLSSGVQITGSDFRGPKRAARLTSAEKQFQKSHRADCSLFFDRPREIYDVSSWTRSFRRFLAPILSSADHVDLRRGR